MNDYVKCKNSKKSFEQQAYVLDSFSEFFKTIYFNQLNYLNINSPKEFSGIELKSLKRPFFNFKKKTTFDGFLKYIDKYYGITILDDKPKDIKTRVKSKKYSFDQEDYYFIENKDFNIFVEKAVSNKTFSQISQEVMPKISRERARQINLKVSKFVSNNIDKDILLLLQDKCKKEGVLLNGDIENNSENKKSAKILKYLAQQGLVEGIIYIKELDGIQTNTIRHLGKVIEDIKKQDIQFIEKKDFCNLVFTEHDGEKQEIDQIIEKLKQSNLITTFKVDDLLFITPKPTTKTRALEIFIAMNKSGVHVFKEQAKVMAFLNKEVQANYKINDKKRESFGILIENNPNIALWGWGIYIHTMNIKSILTNFQEDPLMLKQIDEAIKSDHIYNVKKYFNELKSGLLSAGIPNEYALYTVLRNKYSDRYVFQHSPWIKSKDEKNRLISDIIADLLKKRTIPFSVSEAAQELSIDNQRAMQLFSTASSIINVDRNKYLHKDHLTQEIIKKAIFRNKSRKNKKSLSKLFKISETEVEKFLNYYKITQTGEVK